MRIRFAATNVTAFTLAAITTAAAVVVTRLLRTLFYTFFRLLDDIGVFVSSIGFPVFRAESLITFMGSVRK